jgi:endo-1,4-beta-xylanase
MGGISRIGASSALTRRAWLTGFAATACLPASPLLAQADEGLGSIAARHGITFGASIAREALDDPAYGALYQKHARIVTSDYALKFEALRPTAEQWRYEQADALVAFARQNDMKFRGHALIWNENAPAWLRALSRRETERVFDEHIDTVMGRYAGTIASWDVVNEPFWPDHGERGGFRRGPWYEALGPNYIRYAFKRAAGADPKAELVLNEAFTERDDTLGRQVRAHLLTLIDRLLDAGTPLKAIGLQAHLQPQFPFSTQAIADFLGAIAERKLPILITELDVDDLSMPADTTERDKQVAAFYERYLTTALAVPNVTSLITWQLADRYSWMQDAAFIKATKRGFSPRPLPFDAKLQKKQAYFTIEKALRTRPVKPS